ncbi:MAG: ATP-grasp domain-containing protein [Pseudomonadota bacterium]
MKQSVLILAQSARMITAAASDAGFNAHAIDLFGDCDTVALASSYHRLPHKRNFAIEKRATHLLVRSVMATEGQMPIVFASGFEAACDLLNALAKEFTVLGSPPDTVASLFAVPEAFSKLAKEGVSVPKTQYGCPQGDGAWLIKRCGASGGDHVRRFINQQPGPKDYFQAYVCGHVRSFFFLAGAQIVPVLFTKQLYWSRATRFRYEGAVGYEPPTPEIEAVMSVVKVVSKIFALKGGCSIDYIVGAGGVTIIDINPRLPASLALVADPHTVFKAHFAACTGQPVLYSRASNAPTSAHLILYARGRWQVPATINWPPGFADLPQPGETVRAGNPLCSVNVRAPSESAALGMLLTRVREAITKLPGDVPLPQLARVVPR